METIKELLDAAKKAANVETDYALAKILEIPRQRISDYYKGERFPDPFACLQLSKVLNRPKDEIDSIVQIEAEKDETRREVWRDYLKRLGGYAASIMLSILAGIMFVTLIVTTTQKTLANTGVERVGFYDNTNYAFEGRKNRNRFKTLIEVVRRMLANALPRACIAG